MDLIKLESPARADDSDPSIYDTVDELVSLYHNII